MFCKHFTIKFCQFVKKRLFGAKTISHIKVNNTQYFIEVCLD